jgi:tetratricopeptide (TPR) repeat protein
MRHSIYLSWFLWFIVAASAVPAQAVEASAPQTTVLQQDRDLRAAERERDIALVNERIVQSELKRLDSQSSIFQAWMGAYGLLLALLVVAFGIFTYRDGKRVAVEEARKTASSEAATVARAEVQAAHNEIQIIKDKMVELLTQTEGHAAKVRELSEGTETQLSTRPSDNQPASDLTALEQSEVERAADEIREDKPRNWSIKDLKILMLESRSNQDWFQLLKDTEAMLLLFGDDPDACEDALFWKARALSEMGRYEDAASGWQQYIAECPDCETNDKAGAHYNWGLCFVRLAESTKGAEAEKYLRDACEKYEQSTNINPDSPSTWYNWGCALDNLSRSVTGKKSEAFAKNASKKYAQAVSIAPEKQEAWYNWTVNLKTRAASATGAEQRVLYREALEKAERANALPPNDAQNLIDEIRAALSEGEASSPK